MKTRCFFDIIFVFFALKNITFFGSVIEKRDVVLIDNYLMKKN